MKDSFFVHPSSFVDEGASIGENTKIWYFCHIQNGSKIGKNCSLGQNVNISKNVIIGDSCKIQNNVSIYEGVELENEVFCGPSCVFTNDLTPRAKYPKAHSNYRKTLIKKGASIGANATIVCDITIGEYAMIGAGAVVTCDVPAHSLMLGVPAKQRGWACECGQILKQIRENKFECPDCKRKYILKKRELKEER